MDRKRRFNYGSTGRNIRMKRNHYPYLDNTTLREAVNAYCGDDEKERKRIIEKYGDISEWNTSQVTNMIELFENKKTFNGDVSKWDVSKVTHMGGYVL